MNSRFYKVNFQFVANRYEEWQAGRCISKGSISTEIVAEITGNTIHFELDDIGEIRMLKSFDFDIYGEDYCILPDRIKYTYGTNDFNPIVPIICHIFYNGMTMQYVRFAMTNPDRLVEFYGTLVKCGQPSMGQKMETDYNSTRPTKEIIKTMIETISHIQDQFDKVAEQMGDPLRGVQMRHGLEQFKFPLFYAWQGYKYGWHTDWCKEGDSLFPFMMFEIDMVKNTQDLLGMLQSESPFVGIERNSAITNALIAIYTAFINDIKNKTIKF